MTRVEIGSLIAILGICIAFAMWPEPVRLMPIAPMRSTALIGLEPTQYARIICPSRAWLFEPGKPQSYDTMICAVEVR